LTSVYLKAKIWARINYRKNSKKGVDNGGL
jgi:hypothetical protein